MHRAATGAVEQGGRIAAVHRADGVVSVRAGRTLEHGAALLDLHQRKAQRHADAWHPPGGHEGSELLHPGQAGTHLIGKAGRLWAHGGVHHWISRPRRRFSGGAGGGEDGGGLHRIGDRAGQRQGADQLGHQRWRHRPGIRVAHGDQLPGQLVGEAAHAEAVTLARRTLESR